jgi:hypothetical protein
MVGILDDCKKKDAEMRLAAKIWWLILWYASDEGRLEVPSEQEWLTWELAASIIDEVSGEKFRYSWGYDADRHPRSQSWNEWPETLNDEMVECERHYYISFDKKTHEGRLRDLMRRFVWQDGKREGTETRYDSELKLFHEQSVRSVRRRPRFKPCGEMYVDAMGELFRLVPDHHAEVSEWCRKIAKIMRPHVERDVAFIKKHYSW